MLHCLRILLLTAAVVMFQFGSARTQEEGKSESRITGFLGGYGGIFSVSYPQVERDGQLYGFEDIYGSKTGPSYGVQGGIGLGDIGIFLVLKSRIWKIKGKPLIFGNSASVNIEAEFQEQFIYFGGRYCFVGQKINNNAFLPFAGVGLVSGEVKESLNGTWDGDIVSDEATVDASGFYIEGGAHFFLSPGFAVGGLVEYSKISLKVPDYGGLYGGADTDGGGGISINFTLNLFLGRAMRTP